MEFAIGALIGLGIALIERGIERWYRQRRMQEMLARSEVTEWISIPVEKADEMIAAWIQHIETSLTAIICKCPWQIHPDDANKKTGRRMRRMDTHPDCPQHTKEGLIKGFLSKAGKREIY